MDLEAYMEQHHDDYFDVQTEVEESPFANTTASTRIGSTVMAFRDSSARNQQIAGLVSTGIAPLTSTTPAARPAPLPPSNSNQRYSTRTSAIAAPTSTSTISSAPVLRSASVSSSQRSRANAPAISADSASAMAIEVQAAAGGHADHGAEEEPVVRLRTQSIGRFRGYVHSTVFDHNPLKRKEIIAAANAGDTVRGDKLQAAPEASVGAVGAGSLVAAVASLDIQGNSSEMFVLPPPPDYEC